MKMKVLQFPLIRITIGFVLGLTFAQLIKPNPLLITLLILAGFSGLLFYYFYSKKELIQKPYFGILTLLLSFLIGIFTLISHNQTYNSNHYLHQIVSEKEYAIELIINEKLKSSNFNDRYVANVYELNNKKSYGKIIFNIRKDSSLNAVPIGSKLKVFTSFYKNRKPNNPNQFDYSKYLTNKQICAQVYANLEDIKISKEVDKSLSYYADKLRTKIIHNLEINKFNKDELSVVIALILGQQQDISQEISQDYQYAGAVHVLSVSGLHVGFILLFITFLLKPLPNTRKGSVIKLVIVIISLWAFGILAGLAPSVVRSVTMFTFVAIGMFLGRSVNIYNTLLVSALIILLFEPSFLFDVGFQLSYLALFFIVWLQPLLNSLWKPKHKLTTYFWEIITVSFAAQIGTFPISLYYFHQFPGLFFITNIIILPAMSIILGLGVIVMLLAAFDVVWIPLLKLLEWSIWLLNSTIKWIASFENFVFKDIAFSSFMMLACYLILFSFIFWIKKPTFQKLAFFLIGIISLQTIILFTKYNLQKENEFIVFNKKKNTLITKRNGDEATLYSNDSIIKSANEDYVLKAYLVANFSKIKSKNPIRNLYFFNQKKIMIIDSSAVYLKEEKPDILILTQSPKLNLERLFQTWKPQQVVVDASNFKTYVKAWKATCIKEKIPFHDTTEKGFFKL